MISIVFPAYNEEKNVGELHRRLLGVLKNIGEPFEIVAVNNASTDQTLAELKKLSPIKIITLAYNIGQTAGLDAGIHDAKGDIIITMDADLQNDPADIPLLVAKIREGNDVVSGWRLERHDSVGRRILSRLANWLTARMTGLYLHDSACALKAYRRDVIQPIHLYGEMHVFLPALLFMRGAKVTEIPVRHHARQFGISKHYFFKAVKDIFDLLTIKFLTCESFLNLSEKTPTTNPSRDQWWMFVNNGVRLSLICCMVHYTHGFPHVNPAKIFTHYIDSSRIIL